MKRLVEVGKLGYALEADHPRLLREAKELLAYIFTMQPGELKAEFTRRVIPLCKGVTEGSMAFPIDPELEPINIMREFTDCGRELPAGFEQLYAQFMNTALGARVELPAAVVKDGKRWAYMEFENVAQPGIQPDGPASGGAAG